MGIKRTFSNFVPTPSYDGVPFSQVRIDEGPSANGPWTPIDTQPLSPLDADPVHPLARSFTTDNALLEDGWYRIVFLDSQGNFSLSEPIDAAATSEGLVSPADVRRLLPQVQASDAQLQFYIDVVLSYLGPRLLPLDAGTGTAVFYKVRQGESLPLPVYGATVTSVTVWDVSTSVGRPLTSPDYWEADGGILRTTDPSGAWGYDPRYWVPPFDTTASHYHKVVVEWEAPAVAPAAFKEGIALWAASLLQTNPKLTSGMRSERIGDYSYTLADRDVESVVPARARVLLKPFLRKRRVLSTG
jgi:hypothetical protein